MDLASLGIQIDSRDAPRASRDLDRFADSGKNAAVSVKKLGVAAAGAFAGLATIAQAINFGRQAMAFGSSVSEVSTLLNGNAKATAEAAKGARDLAKSYGGSAKAQVEAYYQAISAGAGSVAEATNILDAANKLAIGGVSDVTTGVDILTTAINSYGKDAITAQGASDALFVGMKAGKTTITELASSLGNVIPIANAMGVSFDESVAATAALTTQGITTAQAVTGLRASLVAVSGPTAQAQKLAKKLGIDFSTAGLKSKGLAGFLGDVIEKTGGSADAMRTLFGSVEATTAVLALAGGGSEALASILEDMKDKTGAANDAFDLMSKDAAQRWSVQMAKLEEYALTIGQALVAVAVPAVEAFTGVLDILATHSSSLIGIATSLSVAVGVKLAVAFGTTMVAAVSSAITGMIALGVQMGAATPMMALAAGATSTFTGALYAMRGALIASGIGAAVVVAGLLVGKFIDLYREAGSLRGAFALLWSSFKGGIDRAKLQVSIWRADLSAAFFGAMAAALQATNSGMNNIIGLFSGAGAAVTAVWGVVRDEIAAYIQSLPGIAAQAATEMITAIVSGINNGVKDAVAAAKNLASKVGAALKGGGGNPLSESIYGGYATEGAKIRQEILEGAGSGGTDGGAGFDTIGAKAGNDILNGMRRALDINSPSKKAAEIGGQTAQGFREGAQAKTLGIKIAEAAGTAFMRGSTKHFTDAGLSAAKAFEQKASGYTEASRMLQNSAAKPFEAAKAAAEQIEKPAQSAATAVTQVSRASDGVEASFKEAGSAGEKAFEAITDKAKGAAKEVQKINPVLNSVFDAIGKGDLSNLGQTLLGQAGSSFSGLLKGAFTPGKDGKVAGIGGIFSGFKNAFTGVKTALGGIAGGGLTGAISGIGGALSAAMPIIGAVNFLFSGFRKTTENLDAGFKVLVNGTNTLVNSFRKDKITQFWGLSKKIKVTMGSVSDEIQNAVSKTVTGLRTGVLSAAMALGLGSTALAGFTADVKLSTKGMSDAEATQALTQEMAKLEDRMARTVLGSEKYVNANETATQALSRISTALTGVNPMLEQLDLTLFNISVSGGSAASNFTDLFGGLQGFASAASTAYDVLYSDAEKLAKTEAAFKKSLGEIGFTQVPKTVAQMRAAIDAFDKAGDKNGLAVLINSVRLFKQIGATAQESAREALNALDPKKFAKKRDYDFAIAAANAKTGGSGDAENFRGVIDSAIASIPKPVAPVAVPTPAGPDNSAAIAALQKQGADAAFTLRTVDTRGLDYWAKKVSSLKKKVTDLGGIPAFATGGRHSGGLRWVGENGPELEYTGPSSISSNRDSMSMLDNRLVVEEIRLLRSELAGMRADNNEGNMVIAEESAGTNRTLRKIDTIGIGTRA